MPLSSSTSSCLAAPPWHLPTQTLCRPGTWWRAPRPLLRAARRPRPRPQDGPDLGSFPTTCPAGEPAPDCQPPQRYTHTRTPPRGEAPGLLGIGWQMTPGAYPPACRASASTRPVPHGWQRQGGPTGAACGVGGPAPASGSSLPLWPSHRVCIETSPSASGSGYTAWEAA